MNKMTMITIICFCSLALMVKATEPTQNKTPLDKNTVTKTQEAPIKIEDVNLLEKELSLLKTLAAHINDRSLSSDGRIIETKITSLKQDIIRYEQDEFKFPVEEKLIRENFLEIKKELADLRAKLKKVKDSPASPNSSRNNTKAPQGVSITLDHLKLLQQELNLTAALAAREHYRFSAGPYITGIFELEMDIKTKKDQTEIIKKFHKISRDLSDLRARIKRQKEENTPQAKRAKLLGELNERAQKGDMTALGYLHEAGDKSALQRLKAAEQNNNRDAQFILGGIYLNGIGVGRSEVLAERYLSKAAKNNHVGAKRALLKIYQNKKSSRYNPVKAVQIIEDFAQKGDKNAMILIARYAEAGIFMNPNPEKAAAFYKKLAALNYVPAMGYCIEHGLNGESVDTESALELYYDSGHNDKNIDGAYLFAKLSMKKNPLLKNDDKVQDMLYFASAKHPGAAFLRLGKCDWDSGHLEGILANSLELIYQNNNAQEGIRLLQDLEKHYDFPSAYLLHAMFLMYGNGKREHLPSIESKQKGVALFAKCKKRLSETDPSILFNLALIMERSSEQKIAEFNGADLLKISADRGYVPGILKYAAKIQKEQPTRAFQYYETAAKKSDPEGMWQLAHCYETGTGVAQNHAKAMSLYKETLSIAEKTLSREIQARTRLSIAMLLAAGRGCSADMESADEFFRTGAAMIRHTIPDPREFYNDSHFLFIAQKTKEGASLKIPSALFLLGVFKSSYEEEGSRWRPHFIRLNTPGVKELLRQAGITVAADKQTALREAVEIWVEGLKAGSPESAYALGYYAGHKDAFQAAIKLAKGKQNVRRYSYLIDEAARRIEKIESVPKSGGGKYYPARYPLGDAGVGYGINIKLVKE